MISIFVATKNRSSNLKLCLNSIINNSYKDYELLIVDQSTNDNTARMLKSYPSNNIRYFHVAFTGKSKALNTILPYARGTIFAFTDDDCIVAKDWLQKITTTLKSHKNIAGIFGQVLPYQNTQRAKHTLCPSTFTIAHEQLHSDPHVVHYQHIGLGNNMALRKSLVQHIGGFYTWLGPGNHHMGGGEESELIYRALRANYKLLTLPNAIVYHNRWISYPEEQILQGTYTCGLVAFYSYYYLQGDKKILSNIIYRYKERGVGKLRNCVAFFKKPTRNMFIHVLKEFYYFLWENYCMLRGFLVAYKQAKKTYGKYN